MRKFVASFFILVLILAVIPPTAYAVDCSKDNLLDRFGDWFGTVGKTPSRKNRVLASRKTNRRLACEENQALKAAGSF